MITHLNLLPYGVRRRQLIAERLRQWCVVWLAAGGLVAERTGCAAAVRVFPPSWMSTRRGPAGGLGKPCRAAWNMAGSTADGSSQGPSLLARVS